MSGETSYYSQQRLFGDQLNSAVMRLEAAGALVVPKPLCQLAFRAKNAQPIKVEGIVLPTLEEIAEYAGVTEPPILNEFMEPTAADLFARIKDILNNRYQDGFDCRAMVNSNIATPEEIKAIQRLEGPEVSTGLYL